MRMKQAADLSPCQNYRYNLTRIWGPGSRMLFIGLNPSTADALRDDATVRRLLTFAVREGHDALEVVNLFDFRSTQPRVMLGAADPASPENDQKIAWALDRADQIVAGWGSHGAHRGRGDQMMAKLREPGLVGKSYCFGRCANGQPVHPLYQPNDAPLLRLWPS